MGRALRITCPPSILRTKKIENDSTSDNTCRPRDLNFDTVDLEEAIRQNGICRAGGGLKARVGFSFGKVFVEDFR